MKPETVSLEIRNYDGKDYLFTSDGKLLANQEHFGGRSGYFCNQQEESGIIRVFRASFHIDNRAVKLGDPYDE